LISVAFLISVILFIIPDISKLLKFEFEFNNNFRTWNFPIVKKKRHLKTVALFTLIYKQIKH